MYNTTGLNLQTAQKILASQNMMTTRSAPLPAPTATSSITSYAPAAIGAVALGALGYFLFKKKPLVGALGGAAVGGLGGYLAFQPPAA